MKKLFSIVAVAAFTLTFAQQTPKKSCCADSKKECKMSEKKMAKACDMKDHKNCKSACNPKVRKTDVKKAA